MIGVIYKFQPYNKLNGSLFYGFEYASYLNVPFYIVGVSEKDLKLVKKIFAEKYIAPLSNIIPITLVELYNLKLDKTVVADVKSFYSCKEFLTNDIHVISNESHEMFRYKNDRTVTYYGSYDYQTFDVFNYSKLNFNIFKSFESKGDGVFISGLFLKDEYVYPDRTKEVITKKHDRGMGNLFELIDTVHYIHGQHDTNNRIIPEAFFYNKKITIQDDLPDVIDSVTLRYNDIINNGLYNYTLTNKDEIIKVCQKFND